MAAQFGRRLRRGATTTAVAAAAVAALSASQAPGITHATASGGDGQGREAADASATQDTTATGNSPYHTDLPPLNTPHKPDAPATSSTVPLTGSAEAGIPATVLAAYKQAESTIATSDAACRVSWQLLAAIGKVESGQARGGKVDANGTTFSPILGPVLNGVGFANISDTDNGAYDGDTTHDRAVGPMQFIPSTWATWGQDANGDGLKNPNNIYDAALAAGRYLCAGERDLTNRADLDRAILSYNQSREYLNTVLSWFEFYKRGTHEVPDGSGVLPGSSTPDSNSGGLPGGTTPTPPQTPGTTPSPTPPSTAPTNPAKPKPPVTTPPTTPLPASRIENTGPGSVTAMAGRDFAERVSVRVENAKGAPVAQQVVRFTLLGTTDTRFSGDRTSVLVASGADGTATAPTLEAGAKTGTFRVRATLVDRDAPPVDVRARVTTPAADRLVRIDQNKLIAAPDEKFDGRLRFQALYQNTIAADVEVTATMVKTGGGDPVENDEGPYFQDDEGNPVRTLTGLTTDELGFVRLPSIYADGQTGTFQLRLVTEGGAVATVELTVVPESEPSSSASPSSPSPSASATG
ncbi:lytic transglycosylase [Streptomyces sp. NPDC057638]|uniref:lytic transglycosylase domain-containing protein n=1 Tax=Streptomyces sp. NPDC057638 TaxID=3346190 RepID=UPI0036AAD77E